MNIHLSSERLKILVGILLLVRLILNGVLALEEADIIETVLMLLLIVLDLALEITKH